MPAPDPRPGPDDSPAPARIRRTRRGYFTAGGDRYTGPVRYAGRPSILGNPFHPRQMIDAGYTCDPQVAHRLAVAAFRSWLTNPASAWRPGPDSGARRSVLLAALPHLAGVPLACWCRPGQPCHCDVLLELANPARSRPDTIAVLAPNTRTPPPQITHAIEVGVEATPPDEVHVFGPLRRRIAAVTLCGRRRGDAGFTWRGGEHLDLVTCPACVRSPAWTAHRDPVAGQTMVMRHGGVDGVRVPVTVLGWEPPTGPTPARARARRHPARVPCPVGQLRDVAVTRGGDIFTVPWSALRRPRVFDTLKGPRLATRAWPATTSLQGGENGLVGISGGGAYETAFMEAYPTRLPTFLRGEGATLTDAETDAWRRHQTVIRCRHDGGFEPRGRRNGYGFCSGCGAGFSADAQALAGREGAA